MRILTLIAIALLAPSAAAQSVTIERGNVFFRAPGESMGRQITTWGHDADGTLSPDGKLIAFVRYTPGDSVETAQGKVPSTALWTIRTDGTGGRRLVRSAESDDPRRMLAGFMSPRFSPDGQRLYFLSSAWATSQAVHVVDVISGEERFVAPGNGLEVVPNGRYAGHLLVSQHRYFLAGGTYDWVWLITPDGADVGPVGETNEALAMFREMYIDP